MSAVAPRKKRPREELRFVEKENEDLWKRHGDLTGSAFMINKLTSCTVHILDHTAQVSHLAEIYLLDPH